MTERDVAYSAERMSPDHRRKSRGCKSRRQGGEVHPDRDSRHNTGSGTDRT